MSSIESSQDSRARWKISCIGVANALAGAIRFPLGPLKQIEGDGARVVEVVELASLDIAAVRRLVQPEFATPDP